MKNHPTPDQLMSFLYGEDDEQQHRDLDAHLRDCAECATRVKSFRAGMAALDKWKLPPIHRAQARRPLLQWAAAAAVLLAAGIGIGRLTANDAEARVALQKEIDTKLAVAQTNISVSAGTEVQRLLVEFVRDLDEKRTADAEAILTALQRVDARRAAEFARLRRDLDTVAVFADAGLSQAQEQLSQLVNNTQSAERQPGDNK